MKELVVGSANQIFTMNFLVRKKTKKRLIPSFTANSYAQINEFGEMKRNSPDSEFSLGGIYEIAESNLEFTINPDFSQIEATKVKLM